MADEQMADESGWRAADHNARIVADQRDQLVKLGAEIERLRAALRDVVACSLIDEPTTDVMIDALDRAREVLGDE